MYMMSFSLISMIFYRVIIMAITHRHPAGVLPASCWCRDAMWDVLI
jgi:hypothetical protein